MKEHIHMRVFFAFIATTCAFAAAWSSTGHMIVAKICANQLRAASQSRANQILQEPTGIQCTSPPASDIVEAAPWMDDIKRCTHSYDSWHYIDSDVNAPFSVPTGPNVVTMIQDMMTTASNQSFRLHVLSHLVGDIHQPLHCANRQDRGGNDFLLSGGHHNLHALWDTGMGLFSHDMARPLSQDHVAYLADWAEKVQSQYPAHESPMRERLHKPDVASWARESHDIARDHAYVGIFPHTTPEQRYIQENEDIVHQQLAIAGYRLAGLLEVLL